ncbi:hypothetical protein PC9H_001698 [Pleurotus ostreatus]|uniref:Uncharacterized protein n=1 Tax=Pleurotus ostreatus TaxID=5322 RepID=A0A8H7DWF8_PLEOS|nr:uncharacterized protein PC9H_001698 [Pleurotus ostreatus]KAF7441349.1 hypothetical protein PC9H_001698 [Pleurotus ostreatus]
MPPPWRIPILFSLDSPSARLALCGYLEVALTDSDKSDSDAGSDGDSGNGASGLGTGGNWSAGGGLSEAKTADDKLLTTDEIAEALPSLE